MNVLRSIQISKDLCPINSRHFEIENLKSQYMADVVILEPQIFPKGWSRALIESEFDNPNSIKLGVFKANELVGYSFSRIVGDEFDLLNIGIEKSYRGMGLGKLLLSAVLEKARSRNCSIAFLEVRETNTLAQALYQKAGFKFTGKRPAYYSDNSESALLMELAFF